MRLFTRLTSLSLALAVVAAGCDTGPGESLFDPDRPSLADPVVDAIVTDDALVLAGIDIITIRGSNFSPSGDSVFVYFEDGAGEAQRGTILSASPTEIRVRVPNMPTATRVRVSRLGAENFSVAQAIELRAAVVDVEEFEIGESDEVSALTRDMNGNAIASIIRNGVAIGVFGYDAAAGTRFPVAESAENWRGLVYSASGELLGTRTVRRFRVIFRIPPTGDPVAFAAIPITGPDDPPDFTALARGSEGEIWAAGDDPRGGQTRLFRFAPDGSTYTTHSLTEGGAPIDEIPRALTIANGNLYVASENDARSVVRRFALGTDGSLGSGETVFEVPNRADGTRAVASAVAVADDGTLYVGTRVQTATPPVLQSTQDPIYVVTSVGADALYPGIMNGPVSRFAWGPGSTLYVATASLSVLNANGEEVTAPARFFRLETRRTGAPNA